MLSLIKVSKICEQNKCKLTPKELTICYHFWCKLTLSFLLKQLKANISLEINIKTFLPVIVYLFFGSIQSNRT